MREGVSVQFARVDSSADPRACFRSCAQDGRVVFCSCSSINSYCVKAKSRPAALRGAWIPTGRARRRRVGNLARPGEVTRPCCALWRSARYAQSAPPHLVEEPNAWSDSVEAIRCATATASLTRFGDDAAAVERWGPHIGGGSARGVSEKERRRRAVKRINKYHIKSLESLRNVAGDPARRPRLDKVRRGHGALRAASHARAGPASRAAPAPIKPNVLFDGTDCSTSMRTRGARRRALRRAHPPLADGPPADVGARACWPSRC